ncbi:MAG TPA: bifunctional demethylmenaquinone methyltransferase/2-methoxy-6-polyprenyl-1,4-benzoquinol methylase UbiE [Chitinophagales bacterium]|jgi:demethylmenaquinone methyltransferase/2-methoxy-6-polyprenyl-1,4-benzoquinol methylase|nr:bifunctional demethylmenaquinone methyltransferase/2-methoxy-6-polyprenyl-1,4-benzoquinol methylase UbiE [Chitinophagales bacterium]HPH88029.1 bifunctional demethylmenaquinone methyltransferase/2-methoxy-6-polyprenyl-1,4-benzoquinol methylase UbiE [Chitinophagales bacterium]
MGTSLTPYETGESKKQQVATMFNNVAGTYDFLNHFFSVGIDKLWRRKLVNLIGINRPKLILDVATGTADLAIAETRLQPDKIIGVDISEKMLDVGREKIKKYPNIELQTGDSENLQFPENTFDAVSVSFGVRNFENVPAGLSEMRRVLKPKGKVFILEFSKPSNWLVQKLYYFYFCNVLPFVGKLISKDARAYTYLPESVRLFPDGQKFVELLQQAGYKNIECKPLTFGISTIYIGEK